ncbi:MAG: GNAT family N-acetyltransferase [Acidobacteria bacterium]|nr:GNAT family N-acetyltransferase [Acidobacteriota bacterium]
MGIIVQHGWRPGIIGDVVSAHTVYYAREWGFGPVFEAKVAREMAAYLDRYDLARDRLFRIDRDGTLLGSLTIDGSDPELPSGDAHLRWFIVADAFRGTGVGRLLMNAAQAFLDQAGFQSYYLTTFAGLDPARRLYEDAGFALTAERPSLIWGTTVIEQRFACSHPG